MELPAQTADLRAMTFGAARVAVAMRLSLAFGRIGRDPIPPRPTGSARGLPRSRSTFSSRRLGQHGRTLSGSIRLAARGSAMTKRY